MPHLAKIYLMLNESPKEHPGLSPGRLYFPMSRFPVWLHFQLQMPQRVEPCPEVSQWGAELELQWVEALVGTCSPYIMPRTRGCLPLVSKHAKCAALVKSTCQVQPTFSVLDTVLSAQSCPILCDPMNCSPPGSPVHRILQAKILE